MADYIADMDHSSGIPITSILNKLPTKRLDAAITAAAVADIPEQGGQSGGYEPKYAHLSYLPLFPLYSENQKELLAKQNARKQRKVQQMDRDDPDKLFTGTQKVFLRVMCKVSGGANIVAVKRWERRLKGAGVMASNKLMQQDKLVVFTRWTVPSPQGMPWFVDVIEHRFLEPGKMGGGNTVLLKRGLASAGTKNDSKVTLNLLKTTASGLRPQKMWTKRFNRDLCEEVTFVTQGTVEVQMEIVARIQRVCSTVEAMELLKRFEKEWRVPVIGEEY